MFQIPVIAAFLCASSLAQNAASDRLSVTFSDPSRPGLVKAGLIHGSITVKGYDGKEVIVEANPRLSSSSEQRQEEGKPRRLNFATSMLTVEESGNVMTIGADGRSRVVELTLQVPRKTSVKLNCINAGGITVEGVEGEIEAHNVNGAVTLRNVAGSAVAHALNGKLTAVFDRVDPTKPMSFSSMNGAIDLTFPPSLKATLKLDPGQGQVYTDFDLLLQSATRAEVEDKRSSGGKYVARFGRGITGVINGGGPEITIRNFNGAIYVRKAGAK